MRTAKKQEYINSIRHDMEYMQEVIAEGNFFFYWHGTRYTLQHAKDILAESVEELNKVFSDKNYKPWKG